MPKGVAMPVVPDPCLFSGGGHPARHRAWRGVLLLRTRKRIPGVAPEVVQAHQPATPRELVEELAHGDCQHLASRKVVVALELRIRTPFLILVIIYLHLFL